MKGESSAAEALALLRCQRHSFLNHLQVISGWLQLGQADRARRYLEVLSERMRAEAEAARPLPPELGLAVITLGLDAETYGVQLDWRLSSPTPSELDAAELIRRVEALLPTCPRDADGVRRLTVILGPGGFTVYTSTATSERQPQKMKSGR